MITPLYYVKHANLYIMDWHNAPAWYLIVMIEGTGKYVQICPIVMHNYACIVE